MKNINILTFLFLTGIIGCKDQLDIINPNQPTPQSAKNEQGIMALAQGSLYINGFQESKFGGSYFGLVMGYHERMGDLVNAEYADSYVNQVSCPDKIILDNGSSLLNPSTPSLQKNFLRVLNVPSSQGNPFVYEWALMYSLNGTMNNVLANVDAIAMADSKKNTIKAWAYFWKGFAYSRIGSMYYAGIINSEPNTTNNKYVTKDDILTEAKSNFSKAEALLQALSGNQQYLDVLGKLIPSICQVGKGGPPSTDEWLRHINTLRARNILVNTPTTSMTATQWDNVFTFTSNGIKKNDKTFTIRTDALGNLLYTYGYVASQAIGDASNGGGGNHISERLIQDFKTGDKRFLNNFKKISPYVGDGSRGTSFNTRYIIIDGGNGMAGVDITVNSTTGADELYIAGSYEENALMLAEANIYKGNIDVGLARIDEVRVYQGAGLATVSGTGLTSDQAKEELRRERRVGLVFRGFSFYDARRWGVLKNGRPGCVVVDFSGKVNTNATIQYGYLGYWDVPIAELFYNPASADSAPTENPDK